MKKELIGKTLELVEKKGQTAVSMRDLAKKLGVSAMAAYRHFGSKEELLLEVAALGFEHLTEEGQRAAAKSRGAVKKLEAVMYAYYQFGQKHRNLFELMFALKKKEQLSSNYMTSARKSFGIFCEHVEACIGEPDLLSQDFEQQFASSTWAFIHGLTVLAQSGYFATAEGNEASVESRIKTQISDFVTRMKGP